MENFVRKATLLFIFAYFCLLNASVFAAGSLDPNLSKADALIAEKEYDEALQILSEFSIKNPDNFELAHKRVKKIKKIKDEFDRTAQEMINTLLNEPENSEKILGLTKKLETLEKANSPLLLSFLTSTREIAQFNVYRNQLAVILSTGRAQLDKGDCEAALHTYAGGMALMRDEFFAEGRGGIIESRVIRETENINSIIGAFRPASAPLGTTSAELVNVINAGDLSRSAEIIRRLNPEMDGFIELKRRLYSSADVLNNILAELRANDPEMGERNHLAFLYRVIYGRSGESIQEGMLGAFETYWQNSVGAVVNAIMQNAERANSAGLAAFNAGEYSNAITALNRIEGYFNLSPQFFERHRMLNGGERPQTITLFGRNILRDDIPSYTNLLSINESGNYLRQAANLGSASGADSAGGLLTNIDRSSLTRWQEGNINPVTALNNEQNTMNAITRLQTSIENIKGRAIQTDAEINTYNDTPYIKNSLAAIEKIYISVINEKQQSLNRYYTIASGDLQRSLTARRGDFEKGKQFLDGHYIASADGINIIVYYPAEALETFTQMLPVITNDLNRGNNLLEGYRNEEEAITSDAKISAMRNDIQRIVNEMTNIRSQAIALSETARNRTAQAEAYRQESERLFREAQTAFQRQSFDVARERIQRASDRITNSLEIQESASLRQTWDTQLMNLGQAIALAENELIISEVRNLVNSARNTYFAGNFQQAEEMLVRARNRWLFNNTDENEEIVYWLGMVRGAMSARSGREIPPTAPLYPVMSQLLSEARKNYEEGVRFINAGNRSQGLAKFEEARRLTGEVRLMFPVNQDAGILELRMEQFTDPTAFNASFEQRLRNAIAGTKRRSMESFADLQNLAQINPNYSGIRGIITQAEIDMGLRPPPPDPRNIARSRELTTLASRTLENNTTNQFEVALAQVNEALTLNPDNAEAARVKDRLLNRMSVPGAVVLSRQDEDEYQRAVRELQAGNNLVAMAVIERLMQNPRNRNITKLVELQRRIQSVL